MFRDLAIEEGEAARKSAKDMEARLRQRLQEVVEREVRCGAVRCDDEVVMKW